MPERAPSGGKDEGNDTPLVILERTPITRVSCGDNPDRPVGTMLYIGTAQSNVLSLVKAMQTKEDAPSEEDTTTITAQSIHSGVFIEGEVGFPVTDSEKVDTLAITFAGLAIAAHDRVTARLQELGLQATT
jgi:hypothetical protein